MKNKKKNIKEPHPKKTIVRGIIILVVAALFYYYENCLQYALGPIKGAIINDLQLSNTSFGLLAASFSISYSCMQLPVGLFVDTYGARFLLTSACFLCAMGGFLFSYAPSLLVLTLARVMQGIGGSFAVVSAMYLAKKWIPHYFGMAIGPIVAIGAFGSASSGFIINKLIAHIFWRDLMCYGGIVGLLLAILIGAIIKNKPANRALQEDLPPCPNKKIGDLLKELPNILGNTQVWLASLVSSLMFVPVVSFAYWGQSFFEIYFNLAKEPAGHAVSLIFIGFAVGAPFWGWLSDKLQSHKKAPLVGVIGVLLITIGIVVMSNSCSSFIVLVTMFILGFFASATIIMISAVTANIPKELVGSAIGFLNTINAFFANVIAPLALGVLLDWFKKEGQAPTPQNYQYALLIVLFIACIGGLILIMPLRETYVKNIKQGS